VRKANRSRDSYGAGDQTEELPSASASHQYAAPQWMIEPGGTLPQFWLGSKAACFEGADFSDAAYFDRMICYANLSLDVTC
jgi:hypothetical protein